MEINGKDLELVQCALRMLRDTQISIRFYGPENLKLYVHTPYNDWSNAIADLRDRVTDAIAAEKLEPKVPEIIPANPPELDDELSPGSA